MSSMRETIRDLMEAEALGELSGEFRLPRNEVGLLRVPPRKRRKIRTDQLSHSGGKGAPVFSDL